MLAGSEACWRWAPHLLCLPNAPGVSLESAGMSRMPQVGLVGPASATFPVVASGEPVSVPDNLLKICEAKPVIFKGKCCSGRGGGGEPAGSLGSSDPDSSPRVSSWKNSNLFPGNKRAKQTRH